MTVEELIKRLSEYDPTLPVFNDCSETITQVIYKDHIPLGDTASPYCEYTPGIKVF